MSKKAVMISVDSVIHTEAKQSGINISNVCEDALRKRLNMSLNASPEKVFCSNCGKHRKEMVWDGYMECWKCSKCCKSDVRSVSIMAKS